MSLKRDMLVEAGITDKSVIDNIMQAYGAGIENAKSQAESELQAENDSLKQQLEQQRQALEGLQAKEGASEELKQQLTDLQAQFDTYKSENEANLAQVKKTNAVALALKDVGAYNSEDLMKFIDLDKIELGEDGKPVLEETINGLCSLLGSWETMGIIIFYWLLNLGYCAIRQRTPRKILAQKIKPYLKVLTAYKKKRGI